MDHNLTEATPGRQWSQVVEDIIQGAINVSLIKVPLKVPSSGINVSSCVHRRHRAQCKPRGCRTVGLLKRTPPLARVLATRAGCVRAVLCLRCCSPKPHSRPVTPVTPVCVAVSHESVILEGSH